MWPERKVHSRSKGACICQFRIKKWRWRVTNSNLTLYCVTPNYKIEKEIMSFKTLVLLWICAMRERQKKKNGERETTKVSTISVSLVPSSRHRNSKKKKKNPLLELQASELSRTGQIWFSKVNHSGSLSSLRRCKRLLESRGGVWAKVWLFMQPLQPRNSLEVESKSGTAFVSSQVRRSVVLPTWRDRQRTASDFGLSVIKAIKRNGSHVHTHTHIYSCMCV